MYTTKPLPSQLAHLYPAWHKVAAVLGPTPGSIVRHLRICASYEFALACPLDEPIGKLSLHSKGLGSMFKAAALCVPSSQAQQKRCCQILMGSPHLPQDSTFIDWTENNLSYFAGSGCTNIRNLARPEVCSDLELARLHGGCSSGIDKRLQQRAASA